MPQKAPGKLFRKGLSLSKLFEMFPDDATAEKWFVEQRWPQGVCCPECGSFNVQTRKTRKPQPYRCRDCRKDFSTKTGSLMEGSKLGFKTWVIAIYQLSTNLKSISSMRLSRDLEVTQKTAWYLAQRIRETWVDNQDALEDFAGPVEIDETYMGGKRRNMSNSKRKELKDTGRGSVGKVAVVGVKDRETNKVSAKVVESTDKATLQVFLADKASPDAKVYSDDSTSYSGMPFDHESVNHSVSEYVRDQAHTNGIESHWATIKRAHKGVFHKLSHKHLHRYVNEFSGRHNDRCEDTLDIMQNIAKGLQRKHLPYQALIADNGLPSGARS